MFYLYYPQEGSPINSVELKNPDFDNFSRIDSGTINRQARHGSPLTGRDDAWPFLVTKGYVFKEITKTVVDDFKAFLIATAGLEIRIVDHNEDEYTGIIITNENEIITIIDTCSYDISFEFLEV